MIKLIILGGALFAFSEFMFCLGKGYMIGVTRSYNKELGDEFEGFVKRAIADESLSIGHRICELIMLSGIRLYDSTMGQDVGGEG